MEFFFALCLTRFRAIILPVHLPTLFGREMVMFGQIKATSVMVMLPPFVMSFLVQRYIIRGLTLGAVKQEVIIES